jgi:hypothetical protein
VARTAAEFTGGYVVKLIHGIFVQIELPTQLRRAIFEATHLALTANPERDMAFSLDFQNDGGDKTR